MYNDNLKDLREIFKDLYEQAGIKDNRIVLLLSGQQATNEQVLYLLNDLLLSGDIPHLYTKDEMDEKVETVRKEVKENLSMQVRMVTLLFPHFQQLLQLFRLSRSTLLGRIPVKIAGIISYAK